MDAGGRVRLNGCREACSFEWVQGGVQDFCRESSRVQQWQEPDEEVVEAILVALRATYLQMSMHARRRKQAS